MTLTVSAAELAPRVFAVTPSEAMSAPLTPHAHGSTILIDGREIGWAAFGDPEGDPVFWFHGTPGGRAQLPHDIDDLARTANLRIVGVERPGTGHSTPYRYLRVVEFADDLRQVADDLGADKFACVGLSGGGPFVLAVAHEMPERMVCGQVLGGVGPTRGADSILSHTLLLVPLSGLIERIAEPVGQAITSLIKTVEQYADPAIDIFFKFQPGDRKAFNERTLDKRQMTADLIDAAHRSGIGAPFEDLAVFGKHWGFELGDIRVPITFHAGNSDVIVPYVHAERQAKRVPGARLRTHQRRGHFAGYTHPEEVVAEIRRLWPATPTAPTSRAARSRRKSTPTPSSVRKRGAGSPPRRPESRST